MRQFNIGYFFVKFPWYPLTFVCSEIKCLISNGYRVKIFTFKRGKRFELHDEFQDLWENIETVDVGSPLRQILFYYYFRTFFPRRVRLLARRLQPYAQGRSNILTDPYLLPAFSLAYHIKKRKDICYLHNHFTGKASTLTYMASQLLCLPRGFTTHADSFVVGKYKLLEDQIRDSAVVFSETQQAIQNIHNLFPNAKGSESIKIIHKPTGVNLTNFNFSDNLRNGFNLISVSRFDSKKGLIYLVEACCILRERKRPVHCIMIGDASNPKENIVYQEIVEYIARERLENVIDLPGFLPRHEHIRFLRNSSIFIAPSIITMDGARDGVPTSLIEAMAVGLVPIATKAGAITELVRNEVNGLIVPERDPESIASAIERIVSDDALFERLRRNARTTVELERNESKNEMIFVNHLKMLFNRSRNFGCRETPQ